MDTRMGQRDSRMGANVEGRQDLAARGRVGNRIDVASVCELSGSDVPQAGAPVSRGKTLLRRLCAISYPERVVTSCLDWGRQRDLPRT